MSQLHMNVFRFLSMSMKIEIELRIYLFAILFVFSSCYFFLSNNIPFDSGWIPLQFSTFLIAIVGLFFGSISPSLKKVLCISVICQLFNHIILFNSSMPTMSGDADSYIFAAKKVAAYPNLFEGFKAFLHGIAGSYYDDLSDLGYISILSSLYCFGGEDVGNFLDVVLKILAHIATVFYIYKIFVKFVDCRKSKYYGLISGLIFGVSVFPAYYSYGILKESYFTFVLVLSVYRLYKLACKFSLKNLLVFLLCVFWTYMFREIIPFYFIVAYAMYLYLRKKNPIYTQIVVVTLFVLSIVGISIMMTVFPYLENTFAAREEKYDASTIGMMMNMTGPFLSPIPALNKYNVNSNLCVFSYGVINISFAYFALLGIYNTLKNGIACLYPMLFVLLLNSIMVILTGYAINARYTYIVAPLYYSFIPFGFKYHRKIYLLGYIITIVGLTYIYNVR